MAASPRVHRLVLCLPWQHWAEHRAHGISVSMTTLEAGHPHPSFQDEETEPGVSHARWGTPGEAGAPICFRLPPHLLLAPQLGDSCEESQARAEPGAPLHPGHLHLPGNRGLDARPRGGFLGKVEAGSTGHILILVSLQVTARDTPSLRSKPRNCIL